MREFFTSGRVPVIHPFPQVNGGIANGRRGLSAAIITEQRGRTRQGLPPIGLPRRGWGRVRVVFPDDRSCIVVYATRKNAHDENHKSQNPDRCAFGHVRYPHHRTGRLPIRPGPARYCAHAFGNATIASAAHGKAARGRPYTVTAHRQPPQSTIRPAHRAPAAVYGPSGFPPGIPHCRSGDVARHTCPLDCCRLHRPPRALPTGIPRWAPAGRADTHATTLSTPHALHRHAALHSGRRLMRGRNLRLIWEQEVGSIRNAEERAGCHPLSFFGVP